LAWLLFLRRCWCSTGFKFGVVQTLTERLRNDPRNLEISPVVSGRYTPEYLDKLAAHPDVAFVLPRTRSMPPPWI